MSTAIPAPIPIFDAHGRRLPKVLEDARRYRLPDGIAVGVAYSGRVYPLLQTPEGPVIRLSGASYARKACTPLTGAADSGALAGTMRVALMEMRTERRPDAAPVPNVPPQAALAVASAANAGGGSVADIERAWLQSADRKAEQQRVDQASRQRDQVAAQWASLGTELAAARAALSALTLAHTELQARYAAQQIRDREDKRLSKCEHTLTDLRGQLVHAEKRVQATQAAEQRAINQAIAAEQQATTWRGELRAQQQANSQLEQRLKTVLNERGRAERGAVWLADIARICWPRLQVDSESWQVAAEYGVRLEPLVRVLQALQDNAAHLASFVVTDNGWREVEAHIATGRDDRLRVYWRPARSDTDDANRELPLEVRVYYKRDAADQQAWHRRLQAASVKVPET